MTVTPEMARLFAGTRGCRRCGGQLHVANDNARDGAVTCRLCGRRYLHVQFDMRPATDDSGTLPGIGGRHIRIAASILFEFLGRAFVDATGRRGFTARVYVSVGRPSPRAGSIDTSMLMGVPSKALVDRVSSRRRQAA
jgi:hypothetical protein